MKKSKNYSGILYFYVHFITELVCFYYLTNVIKLPTLCFIVPFIYDGLAFVPQSLIGYISDKYPKINMGIIGMFLLFIGIIIYIFKMPWYMSLIAISFGNAFLHISGAEVTLKSAKGKLAPSAIFVSGGSFGVITGKILSKMISPYFILPLIISIYPFILLSKYYLNEKEDNPCKYFNYQNKKVKPYVIIILMVMIVIVRGYIGYGIPTSWNKTLMETIFLYVIMGIGKALGGIFADKFGVRKVGIYSTIFAIPFLCFGDHYMYISLIGILLFSMTMSITLTLLTSLLNKKPGLAFGLTTIGLYLGTLPIFFININSVLINCTLITIISLLCSFIMAKTIRKDS